MSCIFCKIINKELPSKIIYEDDKIFAFHDLDPQAPVHALLIPKKHITSIEDMTEEDFDIIGHLMIKIPDLIKSLGLTGLGVRVVNNCGRKAGQSVFHLHFHIMGGRSFSWPPG
jgi:histidine triad (HIT) family protein